MDYKQIICEKREGVMTITLNRPEKLNAYSEIMVHEIIAAISEARDDDECRAVIITGTGRGFCSGGDVEGIIAELSANPDIIVCFDALTSRLLQRSMAQQWPVASLLHSPAISE